MKKLRIEHELNGHKFLLVTPKPSDAPYLHDIALLLTSGKSSTRLFGWTALTGLYLREPKLTAVLKPNSEGEVGKLELITYAKALLDELDLKLEELGISKEDFQPIMTEFYLAHQG